MFQLAIKFVCPCICGALFSWMWLTIMHPLFLHRALYPLEMMINTQAKTKGIPLLMHCYGNKTCNVNNSINIKLIQLCSCTQKL